MKKIYLLTVILLLFFSATIAQTTIDKYCIVKFSNLRFEKENVSIKVTFGQKDSLFSFKDPSIITNLKMVENQTTLADAFNYLGSIGWTYLNQFPWAFTGEFLFCFKKSFDKSELK